MRSLGHQGMKSVWFITKNSYIQGLQARRVNGKNRRVQYFFFHVRQIQMMFRKELDRLRP